MERRRLLPRRSLSPYWAASSAYNGDWRQRLIGYSLAPRLRPVGESREQPTASFADVLGRDRTPESMLLCRNNVLTTQEPSSLVHLYYECLKSVL